MKIKLLQIENDIEISKSKITLMNIGFGLYSLFLTIIFTIFNSFFENILKQGIWNFFIIFLIVLYFLYKIINDFAEGIIEESKKQKELYKNKITILKEIENQKRIRKKYKQKEANTI